MDAVLVFRPGMMETQIVVLIVEIEGKVED